MWVVVASPHWRRGRHRQGDVGLTARATTQECTQIGGNGLSGPFWGICVHCCDAGLGCGWPWDRNSVHKSVEMAPRGRFGAFVYTVGPWAWVVGSLGIAIVYTNGRIGPLRTGLGHLCTLLRLARIVRATVRTQECTQIGGNGLSVPFRGIRVHCCDTSRDTNCDASCARWHERLSRHGVSAAPPRWPLSLGQKDRLCASGAAARLASSPRRQPTRAPEEPQITASK